MSDMDNFQEFLKKGIATPKAINDMGFGKPKCKNCQQLQSENERLREEKKELGIMHDKYVKRVTKMMLEQGFKINYEGGPTVFD